MRADVRWKREDGRGERALGEHSETLATIGTQEDV